MAQQAQGKFGFKSVQLIKTQFLGRGSSGAVYKARCDDLLCAGKVLHPTLFQPNDHGAMDTLRRFQQECSFLREIRHPNIVQYLGVHQDPETQLPVLLMELMDENLTTFLERSQESLPYHTQVNICHDIALALAYLHSNDIVHRDLSSNNVFVIDAGNRAKVTDFGAAKLFNVNYTTLTPLTMCPGTQPYMSPEALDNPPVYTNKLDSFSFGVLNIQIITQQFPDPGPRTEKVSDPRSPTGRMEMPVLETKRRKSHLDLIDSTHPLLPILINCLNYNEKNRPSAHELCHCLAELKEARQYRDSVQQAQEGSRPAQNVTADKGDRERQIRELRNEKQEKEELQTQHLEECNQGLQWHLHVSNGQIKGKDPARIAPISAREEELQQAGEKVTREKDHISEAREEQLQMRKQKLASSEVQFQSNVQQRESQIIRKLQEENHQLQQQLQEKNTSLTWKTCKVAPCEMCRGSATVCENVAYFKPAYNNKVCSYDSDTEEWSTLPECPTWYFTLTVVNGLVTAVGGSQWSWWLVESLTNTLLTLDQRKKWYQHFPPMPTKRKHTAVVCSGEALVVAGGMGEQNKLTTVEVMNTDTLFWSTVSSLPHPLSHASATVCGDRVYLVGGEEQQDQPTWKIVLGTLANEVPRTWKSTKSLLTCSLSALLQLAENQWNRITDLPHEDSTCVTLNGQLLIVGGKDSHDKDTNIIYSYKTETNSWEVITHMPTARHKCLVTVLPGNKLMVVGGCCMYQVIRGGRSRIAEVVTSEKEVNNIEIATVQ